MQPQILTDGLLFPEGPVWAPDGTPLSQITVEDRRLTNCCFGGEDFQTLYITESGLGRVVSVQWERPGLRLHDH